MRASMHRKNCCRRWRRFGLPPTRSKPWWPTTCGRCPPIRRCFTSSDTSYRVRGQPATRVREREATVPWTRKFVGRPTRELEIAEPERPPGHLRSAKAELLADGVGEEASRRYRPEFAGRVGKRLAGIRAQLDISCGGVEFELLDAGRPGYGDNTGQADQPGQ